MGLSRRLPWVVLLSLSAAPAVAQLVFEPPVSLATDVTNFTVSTGDVNGDGLDDAALVEGHLVRHVRVYTSKGDGTFALSYSESVQPNMPRADLVDVDGDGQLDLAFPRDAGQNFGFAVRLGSGDGTFGPLVICAAPGPVTTHVAFGHLDGDGVLDMIAVNAGTLPAPSFPPDIDLLLGDGDGTFALVGSKPLPLAAVDQARGVAAGDIDGDGHLDFAVVFATGAAWVYRGFGNGGFTAGAQFEVGSSGAAVRLADLDLDGRLDLLVADTAADAVAVRLGLGDGNFAPTVPVPFGDAPSGLAVGDLDGDGVPDLVVTQSGLGDVATRRGLGGAAFGPLVTISGTPQPASPTLAFVDADDRPDVVLVGSGVIQAGPDQPGALVSILNHTYAAAEPFLDLGFALPGTGGFPILFAEGTLVAGAPYMLTISNGPAGGAAGLAVGATAIFAPFKGGTYVPFPTVQLAGLPLDGTGTLELSGAWPSIGSGFDLFMQAWAKDPGGPQGWVATSGLQLSVP